MNNLLRKFMLGGSTAALAAAMSFSAARAQDSDGNAGIEQVVVSASRITVAGYQAPTPVTMVGAQALAEEAKPDIGDSIRQLPAASGAGNGSPTMGTASDGVSGANAGQSTVSLRGLGVLRTLVLVDGQRVVNSNITGGVDLDTIPTALVERVEIVTGGASAAWGSDAVAGVVNLVLNKNFTGLKADVEGSDNYNDTYREVKTSGSWGADFDGGRGHFILSGDFTDAPDTVFPGQTRWFNKDQIVLNSVAATSAGGPTYVHATNVGQSQATMGGLITSNPAGTVGPSSANILANIAFEGPNAQPTPINPGNISGVAAWGGDLNFYTSQTNITAVSNPLRAHTFFGYAAYKLTDTIRASMQINYGSSWEENTGQAAQKLASLTILSGNAYLPASVQATMTANGITSFVMGSLDMNNVNLHALTVKDEQTSLGIIVNNNYHVVKRGVFTLDGTIGDDWGWNAYGQFGQMRIAERATENSLVARINQAATAVVVTAANRGTSGLPIGGIACSSTLTNPLDGCRPLDVFGEGVASQAAIDFIDPQGSNGDWANYIINQTVLSGSMQGVLPWGLPAGKVAVAFGAEYRMEDAIERGDPRGATAQWGSGNFTNFGGEYNVQEGFAEVTVPLVKNDIVQSAEFNAAGRITSYSTSGMVETWKLGVTSQVNDDIRLRATLSTDIRAPNLSELYTAAQINVAGVIDPKTGLSVTAESLASGNVNLVPEIANTVTGGVVLTPTFIPGLSLSADWYSIAIHGAITLVSAANIIAQCQLGVQLFCHQLVFTGVNGALSIVESQPVNANVSTTSGLDLQADYAMDFFGGNLNWDFVSNYNDETVIQVLGVNCDGAGEAGSASSTAQCAGAPKFTGKASVTYSEGSWSGTVQTRLSSSMVLDNQWTSGVQIDNNNLPWKAFLDLRLNYKWNDNVSLYSAIDDVTNEPPLVFPPFYTGGSYEVIGHQSDPLGRNARIGVRFNY